MNYRNQVLLCSFIVSIYSTPASAEIDVDKASTLVKEMAETICGQMIYDGNKHSEALSASATAKVNNLIKQIADIGGTVQGEISRSGYYGVLQEQLGSTIKNNQDCRMHIWDDLKDLVKDKPVVLPKLVSDVNGNCNQTATGSSDVHMSISSCKTN